MVSRALNHSAEALLDRQVNPFNRVETQNRLTIYVQAKMSYFVELGTVLQKPA